MTHPDDVHRHWEQGKADFYEGVRSVREEWSLLARGAGGRWGLVRAETALGARALWRELRYQLRRVQKRMKR